MEAIFDPVIKKVITLVQGQIVATKKNVKQDIKAVLLVGGFGQNFYLKERLRSSLSSSIEVRQPLHSWTAVVRGAVLIGAQLDVVQSRAARSHYGIRVEREYDKTIHSKDQRFISRSQSRDR